MEKYKSKEHNFKESKKSSKKSEIKWIENYLAIQDSDDSENIKKIKDSIEGKISDVANFLNDINKSNYSLTYKFFVANAGNDIGNFKIIKNKEDLDNHIPSKIYTLPSYDPKVQNVGLFLLINYLCYNNTDNDKDISVESEKEASKFVTEMKKLFNEKIGYSLPFSVVDFKDVICEEFMYKKYKCIVPILFKLSGKFE